MQRARTRVPAWYWIVAVTALLFELAGCYAYYLQAVTDVATLPLDQQALRRATPGWIEWAYELAVGIGLIGAVCLLLRRRLAVWALLISLVAIVIQFGGILLVPALRESMSSSEFLGPIIIFLLSYGFWQFALLARRRGWLH